MAVGICDGRRVHMGHTERLRVSLRRSFMYMDTMDNGNTDPCTLVSMATEHMIDHGIHIKDSVQLALCGSGLEICTLSTLLRIYSFTLRVSASAGARNKYFWAIPLSQTLG